MCHILILLTQSTLLYICTLMFSRSKSTLVATLTRTLVWTSVLVGDYYIMFVYQERKLWTDKPSEAEFFSNRTPGICMSKTSSRTNLRETLGQRPPACGERCMFIPTLAARLWALGKPKHTWQVVPEFSGVKSGVLITVKVGILYPGPRWVLARLEVESAHTFLALRWKLTQEYRCYHPDQLP